MHFEKIKEFSMQQKRNELQTHFFKSSQTNIVQTKRQKKIIMNQYEPQTKNVLPNTTHQKIDRNINFPTTTEMLIKKPTTPHHQTSSIKQKTPHSHHTSASMSLPAQKISFSKIKAEIQKIQSKPWHIFLMYFKKLQFNCLFLCNHINTFQYNSNQFDRGSNACILKLKMHPKCKKPGLSLMIKQFKHFYNRDPLDFFVCKLSNDECRSYNYQKKMCLFDHKDFNLCEEQWFIGNMIHYDEKKNIVVCRCESICEIIINMYMNDIYYNNQCIHCNVQHLAGIDMNHRKTFQIQEMIDAGLEMFLKKQIESSWIKQKYFDEIVLSRSSDDMMQSVEQSRNNVSLFDSTKSTDSMSRNSSKDRSKDMLKPTLPTYCSTSKTNSRMSVNESAIHENSSISSFMDVYEEQRMIDALDKSKTEIMSRMSSISNKTMDYLFEQDENSIYPRSYKSPFETSNNSMSAIPKSIDAPLMKNSLLESPIIMSIIKNSDCIHKTIEYLSLSVLYYCYAIQNTYKINSLDLSIRNVMVQFVNDNYPVKYHNFSLDSNSKKKNIYFVYCFKDSEDSSKINAIAVPFKGYIFKFIDNGMSKLYNVNGDKSEDEKKHIEFSYFYYQSVFTKQEYENREITSKCKINRNKYGIGHKFSTCYDMYYFFASLCNYLNCFKIYDTMAHHIQEKFKWFLNPETMRPPIERFYEKVSPKDVLNHCFSLYNCKHDPGNYDHTQGNNISFNEFATGNFLKNKASSLNIDSIVSIASIEKNQIEWLKRKHIVQYCE